MAKKITQIEINDETYNVGGSGENVSDNFINQVDDFSQYVPTKWNEIVQYVGTDTPLYKNGYFYKNSGSWIIPVDTQQIAFQSISVGGEHAIPIVSPLYEGLSSPVFVGSNAYYGMLSINPTVGGKIFDFITGTINTITAVTDNGDETYICVTDGGAREETTIYALDMTKEFDYTERVDAYKNRFIVIEYTDISDYPSSMFGFYIVEETDPNTGTLVENYYPAGLNNCVVTRTTAPVVIDRGTWTRIDVQPASSSGGSNALVGFILANNKVSIVPLVDCYIENGNLYDPTTHEQIYPTSDTYYYEINEEKVYTTDESYELVDVTSSVLFQPSVNQIVIEIRGNEAFRWNGLGYNQIVDSTKAPDVPTFSAAQTRENIKGDGTEDTATLWGKVKKFFNDLADLAFINKPSSGQTTTYLRGDGTWQAPPDTKATVTTTGSGNAITSLTASNGALTATKGSTFLTSHQDISGKVNKSGDTITGTLILSRTQDASGTANNKPALIIGGTDTQAHIEIDNNEIIAKSNGTTGTTLYLNDGNGSIGLCGSDYSVQNPAKFRTAIGAGTSSLAIGTTSSTAAAGNHTHTLSIATDSGTNALTLAAATKYKLTAGGKTFIFTTPSDTNTWRPLGTGATDAAAGNHSHSAATQSAAGFMSAADKKKLDGIASGATANMGTVTSVKVGSTSYSPSSGVVSLPAYPTSLPASDVYAWAKSASLAAAMQSSITSSSVTSGTNCTCSVSWQQVGNLVSFTGYIKPNSSYSTSASVRVGVPGTYKQTVYFGGIQTNKSAVFRLTTAGYLENEGPVANESYYFQVIGIRVV